MSALFVDSIKDKSDTKTLATLSNTSTTLHSDVVFPSGHVLQIVNGTGGDNSAVTHNGATWTNLETLGTTITVNKGNKVLVIANSVNWYNYGTTSHNGSVRIKLSDGTNAGTSYTNITLLWTQSYSIATARMYGTSHSGIVTTSTGSGTVTVTAYVQASTETGATVSYGDSNTNCQFGYTLFEIQS